MTNRDPKIDSLKGFLILLVVIGHMFEPFHGLSPFHDYTYISIYSFHMPLFILLSGYCFSTTVSKKKLISGCVKLFETLVVFQTLRVGILMITGSPVGIEALIEPQFVLWYLLSLIFWRIGSYALFKKISGRLDTWMIAFAIAVLISLFGGFIPLQTEFSFQRTCTFFPFFIIGMWFRSAFQSLTPQKSSLKIIIGGGVLLIFSILILYQFREPDSWRNLFFGSKSYLHVSDMGARFLALIIGGAISLLIIYILPSSKALTLIGTETMTIYLFHWFAEQIIYNRLLSPGIIPPHPIILVLLSLLLTIGLYHFAKLPIIKFMINPITHLSNLKKSPAIMNDKKRD